MGSRDTLFCVSSLLRLFNRLYWRDSSRSTTRHNIVCLYCLYPTLCYMVFKKLKLCGLLLVAAL